MQILKMGNLALRFVLELCMLASLGAWGWSVGGTLVVKIMLAVVIVVVVATIWGVFLSPRRNVQLPAAVRLAMELVLFALAVVALAALAQPVLAAALGVAYLINKGLIMLWKQG